MGGTPLWLWSTCIGSRVEGEVQEWRGRGEKSRGGGGGGGKRGLGGQGKTWECSDLNDSVMSGTHLSAAFLHHHQPLAVVIRSGQKSDQRLPTVPRRALFDSRQCPPSNSPHTGSGMWKSFLIRGSVLGAPVCCRYGKTNTHTGMTNRCFFSPPSVAKTVTSGSCVETLLGRFTRQ